MTLSALSSPVRGRGTPSLSFLAELVEWGKLASPDIFVFNDEPGDVMGKLNGLLGPWESHQGPTHLQLHRRCCMLELLRCLGGFESSWNWKEGVDTTNKNSLLHIEGQETGIFQVSYDSLNLEKKTRTLRNLLESKGIDGPEEFIVQMKVDHELAFEYCARLLRISYKWDGPIKRNEIDSSLSRKAVQEFIHLLS